MRADGIYDVDANTTIDQLSEELTIKMPEVRYFSFFLHPPLLPLRYFELWWTKLLSDQRDIGDAWRKNYEGQLFQALQAIFWFKFW